METSPKTVLETYIREVTTACSSHCEQVKKIVTTVDHPFYVNSRGFVKNRTCNR